jgi:hypothetical protein
MADENQPNQSVEATFRELLERQSISSSEFSVNMKLSVLEEVNRQLEMGAANREAALQFLKEDLKWSHRRTNDLTQEEKGEK